jgi:hypothetical protein
MLRISEDAARVSVVLRLEGRVGGPWVDELARACDGVLRKGRRLTLDLAGTTFVDTHGAALLRRLHQHRVALVNCSPFVAEQLMGDGR